MKMHEDDGFAVEMSNLCFFHFLGSSDDDKSG